MPDETPGLSRRELERLGGWILRNPPADPRELAATILEAVVTLIDKNNKALAASAARQDPGDPSDDF